MSIRGIDIQVEYVYREGQIGKKKRRGWVGVKPQSTPSPFSLASSTIILLILILQLSCSPSCSSLVLPLHFLLLWSLHFLLLVGVSSKDLQILGCFFISLELYHLRQVLLHFPFHGLSKYFLHFLLHFISKCFHCNIVIFSMKMFDCFHFCILVGLFVGMKLGLVGVSLGFVYPIFT